MAKLILLPGHSARRGLLRLFGVAARKVFRLPGVIPLPHRAATPCPPAASSSPGAFRHLAPLAGTWIGNTLIQLISYQLNASTRDLRHPNRRRRRRSPRARRAALSPQGLPEIDVVATARNGLEAVAAIEQHEPDLVFLDVQMPGLDGLGVIHKLRSDGAPMPAFVLCTAYDQYALEAFKLEALDYLLKPVDRERLALTVARAARQMLDPAPSSPSALGPQANGQAGSSSPASPADSLSAAAPGPARHKLVLRVSGHNLVVAAADVVFATIEDGLITVTTTTLEGQASYKTIEELQSHLDPALFWRTHRSYLVNVNHIKEVISWFKSSYQLRMADKKASTVPVSRVQTRRLREMFRL